VKAQSTTVPCATRESGERQQRAAELWLSKSCIQLWHNIATVEEDVRNKKQSLKLQERLPELLRKTSK